MGIFENTAEQALPQTIIHKLITEHFDAPLAEGKTVKKAIFLGYDGFRADGLENIRDIENSAIMKVRAQGGLYQTFSGGIAGVNEQATSLPHRLGWRCLQAAGRTITASTTTIK